MSRSDRPKGAQSLPSPASLSRKLGLKPGMHICLLMPSEPARLAILAELPAALELDETLQPGVRCDLILFWPLSIERLAETFTLLQSHIQPEGAIWAVMPKKKFAPDRGVRYSWEQLQAAGLTTDLVDNKVASIGEQDYGTRFVIRLERRPFHHSQAGGRKGQDE